MNIRNFIKKEKQGCILLIISMLCVSTAVGMFLPYIFNAWMENTVVSNSQMTGGILLSAAGGLGLLFSIFAFGEKRRKKIKLARGIAALLTAVLIQIFWAYLMGNISEEIFSNQGLSIAEARNKVTEATGLLYLPAKALCLNLAVWVMSGEKLRYAVNLKNYLFICIFCAGKYAADQFTASLGNHSSGLLIQQMSGGLITALILIIGVYFTEAGKSKKDYKEIVNRGRAAA